MPVQLIVLGIFLIVVFYFDAFKSIIPNWLNVTGAFIGIVLNIALYGLHGFIQSFGSAIICGLLLLLCYVIRAVGAGDVKLFFAIGAIAGDILFSLYALMYSIVFAAIIGLLILIFTRTIFIQLFIGLLHIKESFQKRSLTPMEEFKKTKATTFPFIYAVIPGVAVAFYYMYIG